LEGVLGGKVGRREDREFAKGETAKSGRRGEGKSREVRYEG
jgi:hypothetical protein